MNDSQIIQLRGDLAKLQEVLHSCLKTIRESRVSSAGFYGPKEIIERVSLAYGITPAQMCSRLQGVKRRYVSARQVAQYLMKMHLDMSYPDIAFFTGIKDHTTAYYSVKKVRGMRAANPQFSERLAELEEDLLA